MAPGCTRSDYKVQLHIKLLENDICSSKIIHVQLSRIPIFCALNYRLLDSNRTWPLLEILIVLPEEVNSRHLRLGENRREDMTTELRQGAQIVTDFLHACLNNQAQHNQPYKVNVFKCFTSWLALGVVTLEGIESHPVIIEAFRCLSNVSESSSSVHEAATDLICTLLVRMETDESMSPSQTFQYNHNHNGGDDESTSSAVSNMHNTMSAASIQRLEGKHFSQVIRRALCVFTPTHFNRLCVVLLEYLFIFQRVSSQQYVVWKKHIISLWPMKIWKSV